MNYIQHLNAFFSLLQKEHSLHAPQISLYMALFHCWNRQRFPDTFTLNRPLLMQVSGIGSKSTYGKALKQLQQLGFIRYRPAKGRGQLSRAGINPLAQRNAGNTTVKDMGQLLHKIGQLSGPEVDPFNKLNINSVNIAPAAPAPATVITADPEKQNTAPRAARNEPPAWEAVLAWFREAGYPEKEAFRFFHHYQSIGWLLPGKRPITNWQSAALKWNTHSSTQKQTPHANNQLHVQSAKHYSDPL